MNPTIFSENELNELSKRRKATPQEQEELEAAGCYTKYISNDLSYLSTSEERKKLFHETVLGKKLESD